MADRALSPRMTAMLLESAPDRHGSEGLGVELRSAADFAVAKALQRRELGSYTHGVSCGDIYWNNAEGLAVRRDLIGDADEDDADD